MTDVIGKGVIEVSVDGKQVRAGIDQAKQSLNSLGITTQNVTKQSSASIDKYVRSLGVAALTAGKTAREAELLKLGLRGATDAQIASANAALKMTEAHEKAAANIDRLKTVTIAAAAAATVFAVGFGRMVISSIDALDHLNDLHKTTGIAVEDLSGLGFLARTAGTDLDGLADSINKLSKNIGKDPEKFKALGITAKDPLKAFQQLADIFVKVEDPQLRAALGAEALGKSWQSAAPALSEGGKRIGEMIDKGKTLSGVTAELAKKADELKDRWEELKLTSAGLTTRLAGDIVPALNEIIKSITIAYQESGKLSAAWTALGAVGAFLFTDEFSTAQVKIQNLRQEIAGLEQATKNINAAGGGIINKFFFGTEEENNKKIAALKAQIAELQKTLDFKPPAAKSKADADAAARAAAFVGATDTIKTIQSIQKANQDAVEKSIALDRAETEARLASTADLLSSQQELVKFELDSIRWRARAAQDAYDKESKLLDAKSKLGKLSTEEQLSANRSLYDTLIARSIDYFNVYKREQTKILTLDKQIADSRKQTAELLRGIDEKSFTPQQKVESAQGRAIEADKRLHDATTVGDIEAKKVAVQELINVINELNSLGQTGLAKQFIFSLESANEQSFLREKIAAQTNAQTALTGVAAVGKQLDAVEARIAEIQKSAVVDIKVGANNESLKSLVASIKESLERETFKINIAPNNLLGTLIQDIKQSSQGVS